jgi:hypothetical protein
MSKLKTYKATNATHNATTQNLDEIYMKTGNLYKSIAIIGRRSNQISNELKEELHAKLNEFSAYSDNMEEIMENREQVEISKYYEKLPHATLLATTEFLEDNTYYREPEEESK